MRCLLLLLALALAGCERPFVAPDPTVLTQTTPDLDMVLTSEVIALRLVVSDPDDVTRLTVNGDEAAPIDEPGAFLDTLRLVPGVNPVYVAVFDRDGNVAEDTLYAVLAPLRVSDASPLPTPRFEHAAAALADGRVLVTGGYSTFPDATADAFLVAESGNVLGSLPDLRRARAGHTATALPDGRVLLLGGVVRDLTEEGADFVTEPALFDPATETFATPAQEGEPLRRYDHAALVLERDGRVFVYVYGGLEFSGGAVRPTGTLVVMEVRNSGGMTTLATLSPPGGIGALPVTFAHAFAALPSEDAEERFLSVGTDATGGARASLAQRLVFRSSNVVFPYEIAVADLDPPEVALGQFGAAPVMPGLVVLSGGGLLPPSSTAAPASDALQLFADGPGRFFPFPTFVRLGTPRARHTATLLPTGRILLLGGVGTDGAALAQTELLGLD